MTKHIWKTHREKKKGSDDALVNIFNIGNDYFDGHTNEKETARAICKEISNATK